MTRANIGVREPRRARSRPHPPRVDPPYPRGRRIAEQLQTDVAEAVRLYSGQQPYDLTQLEEIATRLGLEVDLLLGIDANVVLCVWAGE